MPVSNFADKLSNAVAGTPMPLTTKVHSTVDRRESPFKDQPSGSNWASPHLEWLGVFEEWDCHVKKLLTKKSELDDSGTIVQCLQGNLSLPWSQVLKGNHVKGSFYNHLFQLASRVEATPVHQPEEVPASSSPPRTEDSYPISEPSPSTSPKALQDEDEALQPTSSPPISPTNSVDEDNPDTKLEKDVESTVLTFMDIIEDALESTASRITDVEAQEQALRTLVR